MNRTNTTSLTKFHLPVPSTATFDFSSPFPRKIHITASPSSTYKFLYHWHLQSLGCRSVNCLSAGLKVFHASPPTKTEEGTSWTEAGPAPMKTRFKPHEHITWERDSSPSNKGHDRDLVVELLTENAAYGEIHYRNVCSAIFDADRFPDLASTPLWLRALFALLAAWSPQLRSWLVARMLWVQLQAIYYEHDCWIFHGMVPFTLPWSMQPFGSPSAPWWVYRLNWWSIFVISRVVMTSCYWGGRLLLGMKGEYEEYTLRRDEEVVEDWEREDAEKSQNIQPVVD